MEQIENHLKVFDLDVQAACECHQLMILAVAYLLKFFRRKRPVAIVVHQMIVVVCCLTSAARYSCLASRYGQITSCHPTWAAAKNVWSTGC
eukprot:gnl/TRDRNA2_/TRDRNA2_174120_c0_seq8.p1 gnl/TRDRNA2_/TRDRNA2_174120_c0~~gnl/TRDRNA2_/TRDRNA2_174120_c0_seq8.p1  ORF type:complete len:107 (-),score=9.11 gnl/TRDRNA2_/TRDRNA2_174120_c0_seq8:279-551(-)